MSYSQRHYKSWTSSDTVEWIISIDPFKFEKYSDLLTNSFNENDFSGKYIDDLDQSDLKEYGIINLNDRKTIYKSIIKLIAISKENAKLPNQQFYGNGGWLPSTSIVSSWKDGILKQAQSNADENVSLSPSVQALAHLINTNQIINELTNGMIEQYKTDNMQYIPQSRIRSVNHMLQAINAIICQEPQFHGDHLIGLPLAALFTGISATLSGQSLFRISLWNDAIQNILKEWGQFLYKKESFSENNGWLSPNAKDKWAPQPIGMDLWVIPNESNPYWNSWNAFFARDINRDYRPITEPNNNNIITSPNDGVLFRIGRNIKLTDTFWLKDMPYSLMDIFGGADHELSKQYAERFVNGTIFQTYLNPFNYHCWWAPVSGKVLTKSVLNGLYYSKLIVPDYYGATAASVPYLTQVNARGICIIDTVDTVGIGLVCCIPIGMSEVSSIVYEQNIDINKEIMKGDKLGHFAFGGSSFAIIFEDVTKYNKRLTLNHSVAINVGSEIAVVSDLINSDIFKDRNGNEFRMEQLSDRLDLFDEAIRLITNTFSVSEPANKCGKVCYDGVYCYTKLFMNKMKKHNCLDTVFLVLNNKTNELAFTLCCNDLFDESIDFDVNEWKELENRGQNMVKVLEFVYLLKENGLKELENSKVVEYEYIKNKEKGRFFHIYMGAAKMKYAGKGATPLAYKAVLEFAKNAGFEYCTQESTNPISQHIAKKYGNAKTYYQLKFSDYFENYKNVGITKEQTAMFQVVNLKKNN